MDIGTIFNVQTVFSLVLFGFVTKWYIWPVLRQKNYFEAISITLIYAAFRFLGTSFAIPNMTAGLSPEFYGFGAMADLTLAVVCVIGFVALHYKKSWGLFFAWVYAIFGAADFLYNIPLLSKLMIPQTIGPLTWLLTVLGPSWMVGLVVLWTLLIKKPKEEVV
jgi:hypothetical protein